MSKAQYYEYRCYKAYESFFLFALSTADRRIIYAEVVNSGSMSDSTLFERRKLRSILSGDTWFGTKVPSIFHDGIEIRLYLIGDCEFSLSEFGMRT